jgi:hypothetical protein
MASYSIKYAIYIVEREAIKESVGGGVVLSVGCRISRGILSCGTINK